MSRRSGTSTMVSILMDLADVMGAPFTLDLPIFFVDGTDADWQDNRVSLPSFICTPVTDIMSRNSRALI